MAPKKKDPADRAIHVDCRKIREACESTSFVSAFFSPAYVWLIQNSTTAFMPVGEFGKLRVRKGLHFSEFIVDEDPSMEQVRAQLVRIRRILSACATESIFGSMQKSEKLQKSGSEIQNLLDDIEELSWRAMPNSIFGDS